MSDTSMMISFLLLLGCQTQGSVVIDKSIHDSGSIDNLDTATVDTDTTSMDTGNDNTIPPQLNYRYWSGTRTVTFPNMCVFDITEEGERLTDPNHPAVAVTLESCPRCQVYRIVNQPETVECSDLGIIPTGGERFRALAFTEQYRDGTLNVNNGPVEVWHILEPNLTFDFIATAVHLASTSTSTTNSWQYTAESNFQAFTYFEVSSVTLAE